MIRPLLTEEGCLRRQRRLRSAMVEARWDCFLTGNPRTIYSLTAALIPTEQPCLFLLNADGTSVLLSAHTGPAIATSVVPVPVYSPVRPIESPMHDAAKALAAFLPAGRQRMGVDSAQTPAAALMSIRPEWTFEDAGEVIRALRRTKEVDELLEIRRSLELNAIAYDAARRVIRPGLSEIELHAAMSMAVANELGSTIPIAGDFSCGLRSIKEGGGPTSRVIQPNELCVLDLFIAPAYYFGDTCRTFCAGTPSAAQLEGWSLVHQTLQEAEMLLRPGVAAKAVYQSVRFALDATFWHHAGHGIGYQGHEMPRLVPESADVLEIGDLVAVEPGIYVESLGGGLRLENTYQVGADGVANLFDYPMGLELL